MKSILNSLFFLWFIFALILIGITITSYLDLPGSYKAFLVQSGSMNPSVKVGDYIVIKPSPVYVVNDIVTFTDSHNRIVTHRIVEIDNQSITTKGDANSVSDSTAISQDQIIGRYQFSLPFLGWLITFSKTLPGLIVLIIIPSVVVVYDQFITLFR